MAGAVDEDRGARPVARAKSPLGRAWRRQATGTAQTPSVRPAPRFERRSFGPRVRVSRAPARKRRRTAREPLPGTEGRRSLLARAIGSASAIWRALRPRAQGRETIPGVDERRDAGERKAHLNLEIGEERVEDRRRLGEAGRLENNAGERGIAPELRRAAAPRRVSSRSSRNARQTQPLAMKSASASPCDLSSRLISVVLPAPRKPVTMAKAIRFVGASRGMLTVRDSGCNGKSRQNA